MQIVSLTLIAPGSVLTFPPNIRPDQSRLPRPTSAAAGHGAGLQAARPQAPGVTLLPTSCGATRWSPGPRTGTCLRGWMKPACPEIQAFLTRYRGTYQEDRLRAELVVAQLGAQPGLGGLQPRVPAVPHERRQVGALLRAAGRASGERHRHHTRRSKIPGSNLKDADEGCSSAAEQLVNDHSARTLHRVAAGPLRDGERPPACGHPSGGNTQPQTRQNRQ
jgi:hypothetical protein